MRIVEVGAAPLYVSPAGARLRGRPGGNAASPSTFDCPSGLRTILGNEGVTQIARTLDRKMHELAEKAAGRRPAPGPFQEATP